MRDIYKSINDDSKGGRNDMIQTSNQIEALQVDQDSSFKKQAQQDQMKLEDGGDSSFDETDSDNFSSHRFSHDYSERQPDVPKPVVDM